MDKLTQFERLRKKIYNNVISQDKLCLIEGCRKKAIQSHIIQRKGILSHLISNNHLFEVVYKQFPEGHYTIKKIGWKDAMTFKGLCPEHDHSIFKPIESGIIDFNGYTPLLLLSYRPMLHELRMKQEVIETIQKLSKHPVAGAMMNPVGFHVLLEAQNYMVWDLEFMLKCLNEDLEQDSRHYQFFTFILPKIEVCTSIIFSNKSLADSFASFPKMEMDKKEPIANILFHLIPREKDTLLIMGYLVVSEKHIKPRIEKLQTLAIQELLKEVSDILIKSCGTWACSTYFFETYIKPRQERLLHLMNYYVLRKQFSSEYIDFNLFDCHS